MGHTRRQVSLVQKSTMTRLCWPRQASCLPHKNWRWFAAHSWASTHPGR